MKDEKGTRKKVSDNGGHRNMKHCKVLVQAQFAASKAVLDIQYKDIVYELPHELQSDLKLMKL